jgi:rifampicin phosphotransferase
MYCLSLNNELKEEKTGAKASNLSFLIRNNFPVPPGFVVTTDAFSNFRQTGLITQDLEADLCKFLNEINAEKYMVRSSAVGEDSLQGSFAGQLSSFISDPDVESVKTNIIRCWASYDNPNVAVYQNHAGLSLQGMGVVIQKLVDPDFAGVLFTHAGGEGDKMVCEYVQGHGEKLVSGAVNPESFFICRKKGTTEKNIPFNFSELFRYAGVSEKLFNKPQDIEWVIRNNKVYIVQSRPVTITRKKEKVFWSNTNVNENYPSAITPLLYSIARESYYHYFKNLSRLLQVSESSIKKLEPDYSNIIGIFGCRMYYNMSSIHNIICHSPFSGLLLKSFDQFVGYQEGQKAQGKNISFSDKLKSGFSLLKLNLLLGKNVRKFEKVAEDFSQDVNKADGFSELRSCFHRFIEIRMHSWYHASLADMFAMLYHGLLEKFCRNYFPENHTGIQNTLVQAIPGLVSSMPVTETWKIASLIRNSGEALELLQNNSSTEFMSEIAKRASLNEIRTAIDTYLSDWGFRCSGELMFTEKNYCDEPEQFIDLLKSYIAQEDVNPLEIMNKKHLESLQLTRELEKRIWKKRGILFPLASAEIILIRQLIRLTTVSIASRERVRLKQAKIYARFKKILLRTGQNFTDKNLISEPKDIFYLKYHEIAENLSASDMLPQALKQIIEIRKQDFNRLSSEKYPDDFSTDAGQYIKPELLIRPDDFHSADGVLRGLSACGGIIKGKARVLESVLEMHKIKKGDILVTRQTDPGWATIFPLISGLIVERGGMLSHGAIVAREFGIPAVVGVPGATSLISDGSEIILKADTGEIFLK